MSGWKPTHPLTRESADADALVWTLPDEDQEEIPLEEDMVVDTAGSMHGTTMFRMQDVTPEEIAIAVEGSPSLVSDSPPAEYIVGNIADVIDDLALDMLDRRELVSDGEVPQVHIDDVLTWIIRLREALHRSRF